MRFTEVLKAFCNTFIRKKAQIEPEGDTEATEELKAPEEQETVEEMAKVRERDDLERKIRKYRAFAYHHKKRRIRKKYLKRLLEISPIDRFAYSICNTGMTAEDIAKAPFFAGGQWGYGYSTGYFTDNLKYGCQDVRIPGAMMIDHLDARIKGGIR